MIAKKITCFGHPLILACDAKCHKAFGRVRPRIYLEEPDVIYDGYERLYPENEDIDVDNYMFLTDNELGDAPDDNGMYEGGDAKPQCKSERLNKWCARNCERSVMIQDGEDFELPDFSQRYYNIAPHVRSESEATE